jgi:acyl-CoA synthetase (AMP-forming)/AMP-acid ligase II
MFELIQAGAERDADQLAIIGWRSSITYAELARRAEAVAGALRARGIERFALLTPDPVDAMTALAAASLACSEACTYQHDASVTDIGERLAAFDHQVVLGEGPQLAELGIEPLDIGALAAEGGPAPSLAEAQGRVRPLLVFTTGSTGRPKAARHDWNRLLLTTGGVAPAPEQRWLLAYGIQQFSTVQMLLHVFSVGATFVVPESNAPKVATASVLDHGVTHVSATPTFWRFLLTELRTSGGPLPDLRQITLGGEVVPKRLLEDIEATFPGCNVSQIYGATEFGMSGTVRDGHPGLPAKLLDRGDDAMVAFKIVEGELWVRSRVGMLGYYGEEDASDGWRGTGDLVDLVGDRIVFRGRSSEVINVGGVKVHPIPVEERISAIPEVKLVRAYGRPSALTGAIVAVDIVPHDGVDQEELFVAVKTACADLPAASRPRSINFVESIQTVGNKVLRGGGGT